MGYDQARFPEEIMKTKLTSLCGLGLFLVSGLASAQYGGGYQGSYTPGPPPVRSAGLDNIGEESQITFGVDRVMGVAFDRATLSPDKGGDQTYKATNVALFGNPGGGGLNAPGMMIPRLALDFFVVESVSVGGSLMYFTSSSETETDAGSSDGPTNSTFVISPRVGYAVAFDETFSLWPRAGITYLSSKSEVTTGGTTGGTSTTTFSGMALTVEAMVGISPIEHFAILAGPYVDYGLSGTVKNEPATGPSTETDAKVTSYGLTVGILGYY